MIGRLPSFAACLAERRDSVADDRDSWLAECLRIADVQSSLSERAIAEGRREAALAAGLAAVAALRTAVHLVADDDPRHAGCVGRLQASLRNVSRAVEPRAEIVMLPGADRAPLQACFWPAPRGLGGAPVVICIGEEGETLELLAGRLAPAAAGTGLALLLVAMSDVQDAPGLQHAGLITAEMRLGDCIDHLVSRGDVDVERIAVRGDGLAAALATRLAISDARIAAAVCDGGLWDASRVRAGIGWLAGQEGTSGLDAAAQRTRLVRRIRCPFLVVADERGVICTAEALALQADCALLGVRMDLDIPPAAASVQETIEGLLRSEAGIVDWLVSSLAMSARGAAVLHRLPHAQAG